MYKYNITLIHLIIFLGFFPKVFAQNLDTLNNLIKTVESGKFTYRQYIKPIGEGLVQFSVTKVDSKGKESETVYNFSFADIDKNTVKAITRKDVIIVQLLVSGKQKLIQSITDGGDKVSYASGLEIYATDSENGNQLEKNIKHLIPMAIEQENNRLSLSGYEEHLNWLLENITDVELPKTEIIQKTSASKNAIGKLNLEQTLNTKGKSKNKLKIFNLSTLNPNSLSYKINGEEFIVSAGTRRNINGIRYFEDGEQKNYVDELAIYAKSISNGKDILKVLKAIIPLAIENFEQKKPNVSNTENALKYLTETISEISTSEETLSQNITITSNIATLKINEIKPNENTEFEYRFNLADINANNIDYLGQKNRLFITLPTKKSARFIQIKKNDELENYSNGLSIFFNSIEEAMIGTSALKSLVQNFEKEMEQDTYIPTSLDKAINDLKTQMVHVKIDEENYDTFIELIDNETKTVKVSTVFSNLKKSVETVQEFSLNDINPKNCSIEVKGKRVMVELRTKHLEKIIKTYVDGDIKPYEYKVGIEAVGVERARQMLRIVKALLQN